MSRIIHAFAGAKNGSYPLVYGIALAKTGSIPQISDENSIRPEPYLAQMHPNLKQGEDGMSVHLTCRVGPLAILVMKKKTSYNLISIYSLFFIPQTVWPHLGFLQ